MKFIFRYTPEIIAVIYIFLFFGFRDIQRPWDRVINSDGKGYYAYLPAIFIYKDLQFGFVEGYEYQYYPGNQSVFKEFRMPAGDHVVNKYFPGMAILWLPFFLLGHLLAWLEVFPRDGYALPYQYAIAFSAIFFLWLGAKWLKNLLKKFNACDAAASLITLVIALGTNLLFFTLIEGSMTHVYSFALITGFMVSAHNLLHRYKPKWFVLTLFLFTLIVLIRPVNGLVILLIPFLAGSFAVLGELIRNLLRHPASLITGVVISLILISIPLFLWKIQTGNWIVYTYGEEKLNLLQPDMLNILFSYNRGWFVYTPLAFVSMFGLIGIFRENRFRFAWMTLFLLAFIYVVSCWWVWYYASKCGQRVFIDLYAAVGLLLLYLFRSAGRGIGKYLLYTFTGILVILNGLQFYQHAKWIFPPSTITGPLFWDAAFSLHQKARVYLPGEGIAGVVTHQHNMEKEQYWMNEKTRTTVESHSGQWASLANRKDPYSAGLEITLDSLFTTNTRIVKVSAMVLSPKGFTDATLIVDFQTDGMSRSYNPFYLEKFVQPKKWEKVEAAFYVPVDLPPRSTVKVYFYNPYEYRPVYVDDLKIDFISMVPDNNYLKIDGIIMPNR